jgi:hypothetical protein
VPRGENESALAAAQQLLWRIIVAPEGVEAGLRELGSASGTPGAEQLAGLIRSDDLLPANQRVGVYASAYFERIRGVLEEDFSGLRAALGEAAFHDLATSYLAVHPPRHYSLRNVGERLALFLAGHAAGAPFRADFPWCADLARLEWALAEAFDASDSQSAVRADLASLPPERWAELELQLTPSVQAIEVEWAVQPMRRRHEREELDEGSAAETQERAGTICIWRHQERVFHRELGAAEAAALRCVLSGGRFGDVCDLAEQQLGQLAAATAAAGWLATWLDDGLLASARVRD